MSYETSVGNRDQREFRAFFDESEPPLRRALVARYGGDRGREATAEALSYAWQHWDRVRLIENPVAYLFTVGRSRTRVRLPSRRLPLPPDAIDDIEPDIDLQRALGRLSRRQRQCVYLTVAMQWSFSETAEALGISKGSVQRHTERAIAGLRAELKGQ